MYAAITRWLLKKFQLCVKKFTQQCCPRPLGTAKRGGRGDHLPFSAAIGEAAELPWDLGTTWVIPKHHQKKQDLYPNTKPPEKKFGSCSSVMFPTWRAILTLGTLTQGRSFKLCKGILATSLDGHSPGKYICTEPLAPKAAALPSSGAPGMFFTFHCPFSSCQQKALPWKAKFTGCNDRAAQDHLGTANKKLMLPSKYQSHCSKVIPSAKCLLMGLLWPVHLQTRELSVMRFCFYWPGQICCALLASEAEMQPCSYSRARGKRTRQSHMCPAKSKHLANAFTWPLLCLLLNSLFFLLCGL